MGCVGCVYGGGGNNLNKHGLTLNGHSQNKDTNFASLSVYKRASNAYTLFIGLWGGGGVDGPGCTCLHIQTWSLSPSLCCEHPVHSQPHRLI